MLVVQLAPKAFPSVRSSRQFEPEYDVTETKIMTMKNPSDDDETAPRPLNLTSFSDRPFGEFGKSRFFHRIRVGRASGRAKTLLEQAK